MSWSRRKPSWGRPSSSTSESTRPDSSGWAVLSRPWVAMCTMRYRSSPPPVARARLAAKSVAWKTSRRGGREGGGGAPRDLAAHDVEHRRRGKRHDLVIVEETTGRRAQRQDAEG